MTTQILHGDSREVLKTLDANSIGSLVTDPPYELKFMGKSWDGSGISFDPEFWDEVLRVLKPGAHGVVFGGSRTFHRIAVALEDAGFEIRDTLMWITGAGFPKSHNVGKAIAKVDPEAATTWEGWGTTLKPSFEPIILIRKPLSEKTIAANVLKHGTGGINIDATRIPTTDSYVINRFDDGAKPFGNGAGHDYTSHEVTEGRWPPNTLFSHNEGCTGDNCEATCSVYIVGQQGGRVKGTRSRRGAGYSDSPVYGKGDEAFDTERGYSDEGTVARFFPRFESEPSLLYASKASVKEREHGLEGMKKSRAGSLNMRTDNHTQKTGNSTRDRANTHPTCKPVNVMRWLIRLITPPDGVILDPFAGSFTTCVAAIHEGFDSIGIDMTEEYIAIGQARVEQAHIDVSATKKDTTAL